MSLLPCWATGEDASSPSCPKSPCQYNLVSYLPAQDEAEKGVTILQQGCKGQEVPTAAKRPSKAWSREEMAAKLADRSEKHSVLSWHWWIELQLLHSPAPSLRLLHTERLFRARWRGCALSHCLSRALQPSKHLRSIWWSSEQIWRNRGGSKRLWSAISQMGCSPASKPGVCFSWVTLIILSRFAQLWALSRPITACRNPSFSQFSFSYFQ